ncbi:MAG: chromate efflux transporter [Thiotrichales bacterium]|nr:chromate efflux transporter [Thiotrichales bacterium]
MEQDSVSSGPIAGRQTATGVFLAFLALGLTSFGGPVAHIGYFREAFVARRQWMDERGYADLVALCQMLPGPTSSQVGIGIGLTKAGLAGAVAAWVGFTAPSAILLIALGYGVVAFDDVIPPGLLRGLGAVVVAVVAQAVWGMARTLCPDPPRFTIAVLAAAAVLAIGGATAQVAVIDAGGLVGVVRLRDETHSTPEPAQAVPVSRVAVASLALFFVLLVLLPVLASTWPSQALALVDSFYRSGSLVFGGGHVVLALLKAEVLPTGWVPEHVFLAGYGAAQAVPGPLFTFSAYLGTVMDAPTGGWMGGLICLAAIFVPSFLLVIGTLPWWNALSRLHAARRAMIGVNAAVVGLLLAALYDPVWTSGVLSARDFVVALAAFALLVSWKLPPWLVVILGALAGWGAEMFVR